VIIRTQKRWFNFRGVFSVKKLRLRMYLENTNPKIIQPNHYAGVTVVWLPVWLGCRLVCWTYAECLFGLLLAPHASCSITQYTKTMWKHTIVVFIKIVVQLQQSSPLHGSSTTNTAATSAYIHTAFVDYLAHGQALHWAESSFGIR